MKNDLFSFKKRWNIWKKWLWDAVKSPKYLVSGSFELKFVVSRDQERTDMLKYKKMHGYFQVIVLPTESCLVSRPGHISGSFTPTQWTLCSWTHGQLIGGLNDFYLTLINVWERETATRCVCAISLWSSVQPLNTQLQCPVCSLFYFHADTWKAVGQKLPLFLSFISSLSLWLFHSVLVGLRYMKVGWKY